MTRANPLPLDERRAALISATVPLLERFGRDVSTKQIADAAGIAEGTIFRAFATKDELLDAVVEEMLDNRAVCIEIGQIDADLDLELKLVEAVTILQARLRTIFALFHTLRLTRRQPDDPEAWRQRQVADNARLDAELMKLLEPDADRLRIAAVEACRALRIFTFTLSHPMLGEPGLAEPKQIVDLVLRGILDASAQSSWLPQAPITASPDKPEEGHTC